MVFFFTIVCLFQVLLGLDNAGKTSVYNFLNGFPNVDSTVPSWGFTNEKIMLNDTTINLFDLGGGR